LAGGGLVAIEEAVAAFRRLAEANPAGHLPDLAMSLSNLSNLSAQLSRHDTADTAAAEAARIRSEI
jgi:hypothetical protein